MITKHSTNYRITCDHPRHPSGPATTIAADSTATAVEALKVRRWYVSVMQSWVNCPDCADWYGVETPRRRRLTQPRRRS